MKQPDSIDMGTQMDVVRHRLNVAREDLETAILHSKQGNIYLQIQRVFDYIGQRLFLYRRRTPAISTGVPSF